MTGKPACTLLHLGPGLANGLANLHNADRARVPIVNLVGQHATYHLQHDTPLASDIEAIARPYSKWLRTSKATSDVSRDAMDAVVAAHQPPGQIATLIVPADVAWGTTDVPNTASAAPFPRPSAPSDEAVRRVAALLQSGTRTAILLSGSALYGRGLEAAGRISAAAKAKLFSPYPFARMERGVGRQHVERIHYVLEQAVEQLKEFRQLILVGSSAPVSYFAYSGKKSTLISPACEVATLAKPAEDVAGALTAVADALSLPQTQPASQTGNRPQLPVGQITPSGIATVVGALLPENAIVVDESMTSGRGLMAATTTSSAHDWLANTGGSIGIAMPLAVGAAVACPLRRVLCLSADGSGMYTLQALWTMARESLKITTIIFANRTYAVLKREFVGLEIGDPGPLASTLFDIGKPDLDWVSLAKGMGVPATRPSTLEDLAKRLRQGFESGGPALIEVRV